MKEIIKKTEKEMRIEAIYTPVKVNSTNNYFWSCEKCMVAYFDDDMILKSSRGGYVCPMQIKSFPRLRWEQCLNKMLGGSQIDFDKYYKPK